MAATREARPALCVTHLTTSTTVSQRRLNADLARPSTRWARSPVPPVRGGAVDRPGTPRVPWTTTRAGAPSRPGSSSRTGSTCPRPTTARPRWRRSSRAARPRRPRPGHARPRWARRPAPHPRPGRGGGRPADHRPLGSQRRDRPDRGPGRPAMGPLTRAPGPPSAGGPGPRRPRSPCSGTTAPTRELAARVRSVPRRSGEEPAVEVLGGDRRPAHRGRRRLLRDRRAHRVRRRRRRRRGRSSSRSSSARVTAPRTRRSRACWANPSRFTLR